MVRAKTPTLNQFRALEFVETCGSFGIEPPAALLRGLHLLDLVDNFASESAMPTLLDIDPADIAPLITDMSIRRHAGAGQTVPDGLATGVAAFTGKLLAEMREATLSELDRVVTDLRPRFDELAKPFVVAAQEHGFTAATTSDDVITRSGAAIEAWRDLRRAEADLEPVADVWRAMTEIFAVEPTRASLPAEIENNGSFSVNFSVCFAADDNWSLGDGYVTSQYRTHLDWLAIASGGLRLNTPTEVAAKIAARERHERGSARAAAEAQQAAREVDTAKILADMGIARV
jgi:hypothetical protein